MQSSIEWVFTLLQDGTKLPGFTINPWRGCHKIRRGCKICYAEKLSKRWDGKPSLWGLKAPRKIASDKYMSNLLKWNKLAEQLGVRLKVFCLSMGDIWEDRPDLIEPREKLFRLVEQTPWLNYLFLTKRCDFQKLLPERWLKEVTNKDTTAYGGPANYSGYDIPRNIWMGLTIATEREILSDWPTFQSQVQHYGFSQMFLSMEPLAGPMPSLEIIFDDGHPESQQRIPDWVIVGGESGSKAEPMHPDWIKEIQYHCEHNDVPFFFKQWGEWAPYEEVDPTMDSVYLKGDDMNQLRARPLSHLCINKTTGKFSKIANDVIVEGDKNGVVYRYGKGVSGRLLGGKEYNDSPDYMKQTGNTEAIKKYLAKVEERERKRIEKQNAKEKLKITL